VGYSIFGSVCLKFDDLDGLLFLIDAISKAGNFRGGHQAAFLLWIHRMRHKIKTHRKVDKLEAYFIRGIGVFGPLCTQRMPVRFLID
jgi:hypothetical protein